MKHVWGRSSMWNLVSSENLTCGLNSTVSWDWIFDCTTRINEYLMPVLLVCTSPSLIRISALGQPPLIASLWVICLVKVSAFASSNWHHPQLISTIRWLSELLLPLNLTYITNSKTMKMLGFIISSLLPTLNKIGFSPLSLIAWNYQTSSADSMLYKAFTWTEFDMYSLRTVSNNPTRNALFTIWERSNYSEVWGRGTPYASSKSS